MISQLNIKDEIPLAEKYILLEKQLRNLISKEDHYLSSLANFTAALKQTFNHINWAGFYLFDGEKLYLGPFQGNVACTTIEIGKGVCGTAAAKKSTIIVPDVDQFNGHIACDLDSKSEIVVPLLRGEKLLGVLDIDSIEYNGFNDTDKKYLEQLCSIITEQEF